MSEFNDQLDNADWRPYQSTANVPDLLRSVQSSNPQVRRRAYQVLAANLGQSSRRYEANTVAASFLIDLVADPDAPDRFAACQVLAAIAIGDEASWLVSPPDLANIRRRVGVPAGAGRQETPGDVDRDTVFWAMKSYDAVRAGVPVYLEALRDPHSAVRLYAAYLLAWFPEEREVIGPAMAVLIRDEHDAVVAATACVAAGLCGGSDDQALIDAVSTRRQGPNRAERWSAVIGLARLLAHPDRSIVEDLYACLRQAVGPVPYWPFLGGDMSSMAALTIGNLAPDNAPDRIDVLIDRLNADSGTDPSLLIRALLDSAFPDGPLVAGATFADLDAGQRRTALALWQTRALSRGSMVGMLLAGYGLPSDPVALETWCRLDME